MNGMPPWLWPRAAYVHIPFCAHHCDYCDFAIAVGQESQIDLYLEALELELATLETPQPIDTLFVGGGTPTLLNAHQLQRLLQDLARWLILQPGGEFTIEANPGSLDPDKIQLLAEAGVNRISLGAQSFQPELLGVLGRDHVPAEVFQAIDWLRPRLPQFSLDLIFGVPGQTPAMWQADLAMALSLGPDHVSTYGLTFEKGTPLWKRHRRGEVFPLEEEQELTLYCLGSDTLEAAGFEHYEISNFALPGHQSRHNRVYWANEAYFGFGMGAARYVQGSRELNTRNLHSYLKHTLSGESPTFQREQLPPQERARETAAMQLRRCEGIIRTAFREQTGLDLDELLGRQLTPLVEQGFLADSGSQVALTRSGKFVADAVAQQILR